MVREKIKFKVSRLGLISIFLGVFASFAIVILFDRFLLPYAAKSQVEYSFSGSYTEGYWASHPILGSYPTPSRQFRSIKKKGEDVLYDVSYSIDEHSRRVTPGQTAGTREQYFLFFGCSFTFGEGVEDNETLPYYVSQMASQFHVYNYGFHGYGTHQMLARINEMNLRQEVKEKDGIAVYVFIPHHIQRALGAMSVTGVWGGQGPYYTTDPDGKITRKGTFESGRPIQTWLFKTIMKTSIARYFKLDYPPVITDEHLEFIKKIILASREGLKVKLGLKDFVVLFFPGISYNPLIPMLDRAGIKYLDYGKMDVQKLTGGLDTVGDAHPSRYVYKLVADRLVRDLNLSQRKLASKSDKF